MADASLEQLLIRMGRLEGFQQAFEGTVYRSATPKYATESDLLTGEGSRRFGGRWNPIGLAMVYLSLTPETALAESLAHYRYYHIPVEDAMPRTFVAVKVKLHRILDLRDGLVRRKLRVSESEVLTVDWRRETGSGETPITQRLGLAASRVGFEGLIVTSSADPDGSNLLAFPDLLETNSRMEVLHPELL